MKITKKSQITGIEHTMDLDITEEQLQRYELRVEHVQNVFPNLNAAKREFLMTGITPNEWNDIFGGDEDM